MKKHDSHSYQEMMLWAYVDGDLTVDDALDIFEVDNQDNERVVGILHECRGVFNDWMMTGLSGKAIYSSTNLYWKLHRALNAVLMFFTSEIYEPGFRNQYRGIEDYLQKEFQLTPDQIKAIAEEARNAI